MMLVQRDGETAVCLYTACRQCWNSASRAWTHSIQSVTRCLHSRAAWRSVSIDASLS